MPPELPASISWSPSVGVFPDCGCGSRGIALQANEARSLRSPPMAWSEPEGRSFMASLGRVLVVEDEPQVALLLRGAFDYLAKPFDLTVLERAMAAAVIEHERRRASEEGRGGPTAQ